MGEMNSKVGSTRYGCMFSPSATGHTIKGMGVVPDHYESYHQTSSHGENAFIRRGLPHQGAV